MMSKPEDEPVGNKDERRKRWDVDEQGRFISRLLTGFELAHVVSPQRVALRAEFASAQGEQGALQLSIEPQDAIQLASALKTLAHHVSESDPRPFTIHGALNDATTSAPYAEPGRCIYCDATRYSDDREQLGDEHIIPLALGGDTVLPRAACGKCEGKLNSYEQYCHKLTFGTLRYHLELPTRRPKERPQTLPLECMIDGNWVTRDVPIDSMPVGLFLPLFDLPDIVLDREATERNIYTPDFVMRQLPPVSSKWAAENNVSSIRSPRAGVEGIRFASLIAKIGHSFASAECQGDADFHPTLAELVRKETSPFPLPYLVGGEREILPATHNLHEIELLRRRTRKHILHIVRVRLFAFLATPTYYAVAGASPA